MANITCLVFALIFVCGITTVASTSGKCTKDIMDDKFCKKVLNQCDLYGGVCCKSCGRNGLTACQEQLLSVNSKFMGAFIPKCNSDGTYAAKQCHGSTGYCWCVKPTTGKEISGTRRRFSHVTCATGCIDDKGKRYSPEQSMFDGCNTCTCTASGHFACTLKACIKKH